MPRAVDPKWGEDGYDDWPLFELSAAAAAALARTLDIDPNSPRVADLRVAVTDIANTYRRWKGRGAGAFSRAEARKALEQVLEAELIDYAALTALNERALQCLMDSLLTMRPAPVRRGGSVLSALMEGRIDEAKLRSAVRHAIERLKASKGRDRQGELSWAVAELCRLYEDVTSEKATHSNKGQHLAYEQEPRSKVGRFVTECVRLMDPEIGPSRISRAMRHFIEIRK